VCAAIKCGRNARVCAADGGAWQCALRSSAAATLVCARRGGGAVCAAVGGVRCGACHGGGAVVCAAIKCSRNARVCAADGGRRQCALRSSAAATLTCARQMVAVRAAIKCSRVRGGAAVCAAALVMFGDAFGKAAVVCVPPRYNMILVNTSTVSCYRCIATTGPLVVTLMHRQSSWAL
jgi:hypothetical protein